MFLPLPSFLSFFFAHPCSVATNNNRGRERQAEEVVKLSFEKCKEKGKGYIYTEFAAIPIPNPELEFDFFLCDCARQGLYRCILGLVSLLQILTRSEWGVRGVTYKRARKKKRKMNLGAFITRNFRASLLPDRIPTVINIGTFIYHYEPYRFGLGY